MLMLLAALQSEYGVPDPQQLEGLMAGLAAGDGNLWLSCTTAPGRRYTAWPCPFWAADTTRRT